MSPESAASIRLRAVHKRRPDRFLGLGQIRRSELAGSALGIPGKCEPGAECAGLAFPVTGGESTNGDGVR